MTPPDEHLRDPEWFIGGPYHGQDRLVLMPDRGYADIPALEVEPVSYSFPQVAVPDVVHRSYRARKFAIGRRMLRMWVCDGLEEGETATLLADLLLAPHQVPRADAAGELVDWLGRQLAEDERIARAAADVPWAAHRDRTEDTGRPGHARTGTTTIEAGDASDRSWQDFSRHAARQDPARTLARVKATRRIITEHYGVGQVVDGRWLQVCVRCSDFRDHHDLYGDRLARPVPAPCLTLRLVALPYADEPGYRRKWKP